MYSPKCEKELEYPVKNMFYNGGRNLSLTSTDNIHQGKSPQNINYFPTLPSLPRKFSKFTSLSNYSLNRPMEPQSFPNQNYYHLPPSASTAAMTNPYHSAVTVPTLQNFHHRNNKVSMLNRFDDWTDNTTVTGGISEFSEKSINQNSSNNYESVLKIFWHQYSGIAVISSLAILSFLSPILMVTLPLMGIFTLRNSQLKCNVECDGVFISFAFKMLILLVGSWAVFYKKPRTFLPRIQMIRALVSALLFLFICTFWLFYVVKLKEQRKKLQYPQIVDFASQFLNTLLAIHYLAVLVLELRHEGQPTFLVKVLRSPDGESKSFPMGHQSIQSASGKVLDMYYANFPIYNPYLEQPFQRKRSKSGNYKLFDVSDFESQCDKGNSRVGSPEYFEFFEKDEKYSHMVQDEVEFRKRLKKRQTKLIMATEEAFNKLKRIKVETRDGRPLSAYEAAQSIFPTFARPLQKFLRITRQQPQHTMDSILHHLSLCILYDTAPRAFLEIFFKNSPVLKSELEQLPRQNWSLLSEKYVNGEIEPGVIFQLSQGEVSLLCEVISLPEYNIREELHNKLHDKFIISDSNLSPI